MSVIETSIRDISLTQPERHEVGFLRTIAEFLADFQRTAFDAYHPERHYMRGPGPACAAKRASRR